MTKHIVVGVDGSPTAMHAAQVAAGLARSLGGVLHVIMACDDEEGTPLYLRLLLATLTMGVVTLFAYRHSDGFGRGFLVGTTGSLVVFTLIAGFRYWRARRKGGERDDPASGTGH